MELKKSEIICECADKWSKFKKGNRLLLRMNGSKTFNFLFAYLIGMVTGSIAILVWFYHITDRVEEALLERGFDDSVISMSDFWLWYVLGSLILVGPFVYFHKLCKAMNMLCVDFNEKNRAK